MATVLHEIVEIVENMKNFPKYRWEGSCTCGFATKLANEAAVQDQMNSHLQTHGVKVQTFADKAATVKQQVKVNQFGKQIGQIQVVQPPKTGWKPKGAGATKTIEPPPLTPDAVPAKTFGGGLNTSKS